MQAIKHEFSEFSRGPPDYVTDSGNTEKHRNWIS